MPLRAPPTGREEECESPRTLVVTEAGLGPAARAKAQVAQDREDEEHRGGQLRRPLVGHGKGEEEDGLQDRHLELNPDAAPRAAPVEPHVAGDAVHGPRAEARELAGVLHDGSWAWVKQLVLQPISKRPRK